VIENAFKDQVRTWCGDKRTRIDANQLVHQVTTTSFDTTPTSEHLLAFSRVANILEVVSLAAAVVLPVAVLVLP
jgi:hypothetical protein